MCLLGCYECFMQLVEKQGHNPAREEEETSILTVLIVIFFFF